jgi:diguanylate cyclase (GGDEF)-like protein
MNVNAVDTSSPALLAVVQMLLSARGIDDVRAATTHGAEVLSRYDALSLYEIQSDGALALTARCGDELGPGAKAVESLLCEKAHTTGTSVSTLDMPAPEDERSIIRDYTRRDALCIVRPLHAYGEFTGAIALHYTDRLVLAQSEFDRLRRFTDFAAVALLAARLRDDLQNIAYSDWLTGLANRRWLEAEFKRLQDSEVSVVLIDFDGLKQVNDTLGFDRGDELIHAVGLLLADSARAGESVVRYGGDEFVLVMPETGRDEAFRRAEELTRTLDGMHLPPDLASLFRGASVGPATAAVREDLWDVLRRASAEMRSRKRRRRTDRALLNADGNHKDAAFRSDGAPPAPTRPEELLNGDTETPSPDYG